MIIATAGHVDHGKTALVKRLTGVDTDRLAEEKRRGLSINLGYAYSKLGDGTVLGCIDVPGHRRFINTMISGVSGIDVGLMIVAADDGVMPQTREHVQVMRLLGVTKYILVVTKCDRADAQRIEQVGKDASSLLPDGTPLFRVSNTTGDGIDELRAELEQRAHRSAQRNSGGIFRMSIDRAFHLQGRGLILTGTVASGTAEVGDSVILQPQHQDLRIRSIHTQNESSSVATVGERCAINVSSDIHKDDIERGDWVCGDSSIETTSRFDARVRLLPNAPFALKHLTDVKLHIGAKHLQAKLLMLQNEDAGASKISAGESAFIQFVTDRPVLCCRGDRFLLRDFGETATIGGGIVLDPQGLKQHKASSFRRTYLAAMARDDIEDAIRAALTIEDYVLDYTALLTAWNVEPRTRPGSSIQDVARIKSEKGEFWLGMQGWNATKNKILDELQAFHRSNPGENGITVSRLMRIASLDKEQPFFQQAIAELMRAGDILFTDGLLLAKGHIAARIEDAGWSRINACLTQHGKQIPSVKQLAEACAQEKREILSALDRAQRKHKVSRLNTDRYALNSVLSEFAQVALDLTEDGSTLSLGEYRDHLACGRNIIVEVLEYFDSVGFTRRVGKGRIILDRSLPEKKLLFNDNRVSDNSVSDNLRKSDVPGGAPGLQNQ